MIDQNNIFVEGPSNCGKSFWTKQECRKYLKKGIPVFVLEPNQDPTWPCTWKTENTDEFLAVCKSERRFVAVVDECDQVLQRQMRYNWFANKIRHRDSVGIFLAQRLFDVLPGIRDNCRHLVMFNTNPKNAAEWAESFNNRQIFELNLSLDTHWFLHATRGPCGGTVSVHPPAKAS